MTWNQLVKEQGSLSGAFLQTTYWGDFQASVGRQIFYLAEINNKAEIVEPKQLVKNHIQALAVAVVMPISFGKKFLYIPRGPLGQNTEQLIELAKKIAQEQKAIFVKIELPKAESWKLKAKSSFSLQPEKTVILDLTKPAPELLSAMHPKTRYNIALARRHGVTVEQGLKNFEAFYKILSATAKRDRFSLHPKAYYEKLLGVNHPDFKLALWVAKTENEVLAGNIIVYFNNTATYLHGASSNNKRNLMAPYLLHWEIILEAQKVGCTAYDFWGIDEKKWPGLTAFKRHFGDAATMTEINYAPARDYPLNSFWYWLYSLKKKIT